MPPAELLSVRGCTKLYPGVRALDGADFQVRAGEIHALLGENGAGKSTLIAILTGVTAADGGEVRIEGRPARPRGPAQARELGISALYQEGALVPNLSVAENLYLGREPTRFGLVRRRRMEGDARLLLAAYGLQIDVTSPLGRYSTAVRQLVAIARAADLSAKLLILDEPTSSLDADETAMLFEVMRQLKARGLGIVFVTHFLDQVYAVCDRLTVLRNGRTVAERAVGEVSRAELVGLMLGEASAGAGYPARRRGAAVGPAVATFRGFGRRRRVAPFDLQFRAGEVVAAAGLLGSGRTETALLMFGAETADSGEVEVAGRPVKLRGPRDAIRAGFGFCPEDRKRDGVVGALSVRENIALALQARGGWARPLSRRRQADLAERYIKALDIRTPDAEKPIEQLSGGNQQKTLLARWLATDPRLLILDEPTRGIDVGGHAEILKLVDELCTQGLSIYMISSELAEIAATADRVLVMRDRRPAGLIEGAAVSPEAIMAAIAAPPGEAAG
ncbi:MAG: sugar ABC transporter ATP-binding protein [Phenylobacterium sp.]|nr:MAG: sugar ABC transporter ATP-binding protein [Phenylobacterium sp.]